MSLSVYRDEGTGPSAEVRVIYDESLTGKGEKRERGRRDGVRRGSCFIPVYQEKGGRCAFFYVIFSYVSRNGIHSLYGHELMPLHAINHLLPLTDTLLRLGKSESVEVLREVAASLRNLSLSEHR